MNTNNTMPVKTRMPPSPTGHLHIGTARTALFNYLFAAHNGGEMVLRSEDTDQARSTKAFEEEIVEGLSWLGIEWSNETLYRQSERTDIYVSYLEKLIADGGAYLSEEESKKNPGETVEVVRLRNPNKDITFNDEVRGEITFNTTELGDLVIARSIADPLYHFTVVVDDYDMGITHVIRGEDHISNTPRQILIQEALGFERPIYAHLPLILAPDRSKMSKRHGAVALNDYREEGFSKAAILNYLALLGWNPGTDEEIFTLKELIDAFDLSGVQKGGAIFDKEKMLWINKAHLDLLDDSAFAEYVESAIGTNLQSLPQYSEERFSKLLPVIRERVKSQAEITAAFELGEYNFAFAAPKPSTTLLTWKKDDSAGDALPRLEHALQLLSAADFSSTDTIKTSLWEYAEEVGKGELLWPLRVALTGLEKSPDPFMCAYIIGQDETISRVKAACATISGDEA